MVTRSTTTSATASADNKHSQTQNKQVVMIVDETAFKGDSMSETVIFSLPHPAIASDITCRYMLSQDGKTVYELHGHKPKYASYFINNSVQSNGQLFYISKVDVLFLVLPLLRQAAKDKTSFQLMSQMLSEETVHMGYRNLKSCLCSCLMAETLQKICDQKGSGRFLAYKVNEDKVKLWLQKKAS